MYNKFVYIFKLKTGRGYFLPGIFEFVNFCYTSFLNKENKYTYFYWSFETRQYSIHFIIIFNTSNAIITLYLKFISYDYYEWYEQHVQHD